MKLLVRVLAFASLMWLIGCDCGESGQAAQSNKVSKSDLSSIVKEVTFWDLPSNAVLVVVGSNSLTKAEFSKLVDLREKAVQLSVPQGQKRNVNRMAIESPMLSSVTNIYISQTLIEEFARTNNITVSVADLNKARASFKKSCKKDFQRWDVFIKRFSNEERTLIDERAQVESLCSNVKKWYLEKHPVTVTTQEVVTCQKRLENYQSRAFATNAVIWAHASNVWKKVQSGANFEMLANRYTEDENEPEDGEWGQFLLSDFAEEKHLYDLVSRMKPGMITPPIEGDNGLMILKLISINEEDAKNDKGVVNPLKVRYEFSRIFFRLPEFYETASFDEIFTTLKDLKERRSFNKFVNELRSTVTISFPSGTSIFEQARRMSNMPMMVIQNQ